MNFFAVGFLLADLQLDLGLWIGYAVKLTGGLFMLGGIAEMSAVEGSVKRLRPAAAVFLLLSAAAAGIIGLAGLSKEDGALKVISIVSGVLTTAAAGYFFVGLLRLLRENPDIAANVPEVKRLSAQYNRMLFVYAVVLAADGINRFTGGTAAADVTGVIMYFTKIVSYVYLIVCALGFNRLRMSFNLAHPVE